MRKIAIVRGSDVYLTFRAPVKFEYIEEVAIAQKGKRIIEKNEWEVESDGVCFGVQLTKEETEKLKGKSPAEIQFSYYENGEKKLSKIQTMEVWDKI